MKKTTKVIISFAVAIAVAATVLIVAVFKKGESGSSQPSVMYTLQPTIATVPPVTESWVDLNMIASDLVSDTDAALTASTMFPVGSTVTVSGGMGITQFIYVDQNGNIVDPNNVGQVIVTQGSQNIVESMDGASMPESNTQAGDNAELSEYEINSQGVITKYLGDKSYVVIPATVGGVRVTGIGDSCFANSTVKSVFVAAGVTYIGARAFENCSYLSNVSFVNGTTVTIGDLAFQNCPSLTSIILPVVTSIGQSAFGNCSALASVTFAEGSQKIGAYCFSNCKALSSVTIPSSVNNIGQDIFFGCDIGKVTVITPVGSTAETYAQEKGIYTRA